MTHTPGPWRMETFDDASGVAEINNDPVDDGKWSAICSVESNTLGSRPVSKAEAEANARLIAAAPDLLAALKLIIEWQKRSNIMARCGGAVGEIIAHGDAAIAKAEPVKQPA